MTEIPSIGWRPGMFGGAFQCPRCGFATSADNIYDCPNCELAWKKKPAGPVCPRCSEEFMEGQSARVQADGLVHETCVEAATVAADELTDPPEGDGHPGD